MHEIEARKRELQAAVEVIELAPALRWSAGADRSQPFLMTDVWARRP